MKRVVPCGLFLFLLMLCGPARAQDVVIKNVMIYDGGGGAPFKGEVRVSGEQISSVGRKVRAQKGDVVRDGHGMALAPGFIDMHSHASGGIFEDLGAEAMVRQGITLAFVGQDGGSQYPLQEFFARLEATPAALNIASMAGHATLRREAMNKDTLRASTPEELAKMKWLLERELQAGAFGLSSGLEYDDGQRATTEELIELAAVAGQYGGFYISHVRDEGNKVYDSFDEILRIGREGKVPVEISHIKLGTTPVWHSAGRRIPGLFAAAARAGVDLKADVYPYTYWQSTIRVIVLDRDYYDPQKVSKAIEDNGGADHIRVTRYGPEPQMAGKTLQQIAQAWSLAPVDAYMRIVKATLKTADFAGAEEAVIVTSMSDDDLAYFIAEPHTMFCTDGELKGRHPRGAGAFPRILGKYVREDKLLPLQTAIHKMTEMPAAQLGLKDRGKIAAGRMADLVLFDPATVRDRATVEDPQAPPVGIEAVMVNGQWVVDKGQPTATRPGKVIRHSFSGSAKKVAGE